MTTRASDRAGCRAEVRVGGRTIRYRRTGAGPVLLLLLDGPGPGGLGGRFVASLEEGFRVIRPEAPPAGTGVADWLSDFLQGLGTPEVRVLAAGRFRLPALELALREADQVVRLALLAEGPGREGAPGGAVEATTTGVRVPLLLVRGDAADPESFAALARFLAGAVA